MNPLKATLTLLILLSTSIAYADPFSNSIDRIVSATSAVSITDANATHVRTRAVYVGTTQSIDLSFDGSTWITFKAAVAGMVYAVQVVGARVSSGPSNPASGDIVFLY